MDDAISTPIRLDDPLVFSRLVPFIVHFAQRIVRAYGGAPSGHAADDVAQHCLLVLHRRRSAWQIPTVDRLRGLVFGLVTARLSELKRATRRRRAYVRHESELPGGDLPEEAAVAPAEVAMPAARQRVVAAVEALPEGDRHLLVAHYVEGRSLREVAAERGINPMAVKRRHDDVLLRLRRFSVTDRRVRP